MWYLFGVFKSINLNQEHLKLTMWFILIWGRKSRKCCNFAKIGNKRILNVHHIWLADDHEGTSNLDWRTQQRSHWNQSYWKLQYSLYTVVLNENYFFKKNHLRHSVSMSAGSSPKVGWKWKWSNGVGKSEMSIIWCISITNNVKSNKKITETAQTAKFTDFPLISCGNGP